MAFLDHNGESEFPMSKDKVFEAMKKAIPSIKGLSIENADKLQGRFVVKAGVSLYSWGENIPIQLTEISETRTKVQITSSPKTGIMFGGAFDMGKNRKNIENILSGTSRLLSSESETNSSEIKQTNNSQTTNNQTNNFQTTQNSNYMENYNSNSNAWYEKTWLVVILCIIFFPVGLYALWKNSSISKGWKIGVTAIIALIVVANLGDNDKTSNSATTTTEVATEDKKGLVETELPKEEITKWQFQEDVDKMTSKTVKYASIEANEELEFKFPYDGGSVASLTIRKKDGGNDIYLSVSKGQFNGTYDGGQIRIKFDDEQPKKFSFVAPSDGSADMIFINSEKTIIAKLKNTKKIIIETEFFNEGNRQMEFDVAGFKWE
jgi:hypothetical protein